MSVRRPLIAGNWKMYKTSAEAADFARRFMPLVSGVADRDIMIAPAFTALEAVAGILKATNVALGAQNLFWEAEGAFTAEVSPKMLAAAGWRGTAHAGGALHDPCCGSGTIAIEAAQIACGIAPGLKRRFAFERLLPYATPDMRALMQRLKSRAQANVHAPAVPISASDVSFRMIDFARRNAERAGVAHAIDFHGGDALERPPPLLARVPYLAW